MSPENQSTVKPSLCSDGEGYQGRTLANPVENGRGLNDRWSGQHRGGVGGQGMRRQDMALKDEISGGGRHRLTTGTSGQTVRPVRLLEKSERPIVVTKAVTTLERRGRTWLKRTAKRRTRR